MTRRYSRAELEGIWHRLNAKERAVLSCEGEWDDAAGLHLVQLGLAMPTMIELTRKGRQVAALSPGDDANG
jgi:hypothetical protein